MTLPFSWFDNQQQWYCPSADVDNQQQWHCPSADVDNQQQWYCPSADVDNQQQWHCTTALVDNHQQRPALQLVLIFNNNDTALHFVAVSCRWVISNLLLPNTCLLTWPTIFKIPHYVSTACDIPLATIAFVYERCALNSTDNAVILLSCWMHTVLRLESFFATFKWVQNRTYWDKYSCFTLCCSRSTIWR